MKVLTIIEEDRLGLLLDISYILGKENINIENLTASTVGGKAMIAIQVADEYKAISVLKKNNFNVLEQDRIALKLQDKPGELAKVTKLLTANKIALTNLYILSKAEGFAIVALSVDNPIKARKILKEFLIEEN